MRILGGEGERTVSELLAAWGNAVESELAVRCCDEALRKLAGWLKPVILAIVFVYRRTVP